MEEDQISIIPILLKLFIMSFLLFGVPYLLLSSALTYCLLFFLPILNKIDHIYIASNLIATSAWWWIELRGEIKDLVKDS